MTSDFKFTCSRGQQTVNILCSIVIGIGIEEWEGIIESWEIFYSPQCLWMNPIYRHLDRSSDLEADYLGSHRLVGTRWPFI
jgi:hypothetical protein